MGWVVVPALEDLRYQLNDFFPDRDKSSDGSIGDYEHQQGDSSHNPDDTGHNNAEWDSDSDSKQEVRARDFDKDLCHPDVSAQDVVDHLVAGAKRGDFWWLRYIIFNRKIYHRDSGWVSKSYSGSNPHDHHFHVNNNFTQDADNVSGVDYHLEDLFGGMDHMTDEDMDKLADKISEAIAKMPVKVGDETWYYATAIGYTARKSYEIDKTLDGVVAGLRSFGDQ